jgi:antitoxin (DNA-binding transcriptional repressor) of toxin-antitoxin stability system
MKTLELARATAPLAAYARGVGKEPVILTVRGRPVAALLRIKNADLETVTLSTSPKFVALIERSRRRHKSMGGLSSAEMRARLRLKPTSRGR